MHQGNRRHLHSEIARSWLKRIAWGGAVAPPQYLYGAVVTGSGSIPLPGCSAPSGCGKAIPRGVGIRLPGTEPRRRIVRMVRRIRIALRFEAQRVVLAMNAAIFS